LNDTTDNKNKIAEKTTIEKILFKITTYLKSIRNKHSENTTDKQDDEYNYYLANFKAKK